MALAEQHREAVLAGHPILRHLQRDDLRRLAASARMARHPRGAVIFQKGDPGSSMMAVIRGRVKICTISPEGRELLLNIIDGGGIFGEIAILDSRPRTADAVAMEETDLLILERGQFLPFLAGNPEALSRLLAALCQKLRQTSAHLEDALLREAPSRLASDLLRLAETFGRPVPGSLKLNLKLSQQQIGNLIGASRESVNKALGDWTRAGVLAMDAGFIVIRDRAALEEIASAEAWSGSRTGVNACERESALQTTTCSGLASRYRRIRCRLVRRVVEACLAIEGGGLDQTAIPGPVADRARAAEATPSARIQDGRDPPRIGARGRAGVPVIQLPGSAIRDPRTAAVRWARRGPGGRRVGTRRRPA